MEDKDLVACIFQNLLTVQDARRGDTKHGSGDQRSLIVFGTFGLL